jgi:hypothetical protein
MRTIGAWVLAFALAALGCSGPATLPAVAGVVTVDGRPLETGTVTLYPDAARGNTSTHRPIGLIEAGGRYTLFVTGGQPGAPAGWYKVVVYAVDDPQPGKPNKFFTHKDYADITTTTLAVEVVPSPEPGRYDLKLKK